MPSKTASSPQEDFVKTYFALRMALGLLALMLPVALALGGRWLQGLSLQPSISAYYHTDVRDIFVGTLWAIGVGLIAYKGFSRREDWALNLGGVLACCIAAFPMPAEEALQCIQPACDQACLALSRVLDRTADVAIAVKLHFPAAVSFYIVLGFVMIACAHATLHLVPKARRRLFLVAYPVLGVLFVASMAWAFVLLKLGPDAGRPCQDRWVLGVEVAGLVPFAMFWFLKTYECWKYDTDRRIPNRRRPLNVLPAGAQHPIPAVQEPAQGLGQASAGQGLQPHAPADLRAEVVRAKGPSSMWGQYKALWKDDDGHN
jgi:hypothetical protein